MKSHVTERFRKAFADLPPEIQRQARQAYRVFRQDPQHPGLQFKLVHPAKRVYSVRIGLGVRALGVRNGDDLIWFWIGTHAHYDRLIARL